MVLVTQEEFLATLSTFYQESKDSKKGSVAIACKSVLSKKIGPALREKATAAGEQVLLVRAAKYGNNKHKKKISTAVTSSEHSVFYASLGQILKTKVDITPKTLTAQKKTKSTSKNKQKKTTA